MRNLFITGLVLTAGLLSHSATADEKTPAAQDAKEVNLKGLRLKVPASWKEARSSSSMRLATFTLPRSEGDSEDAELAIFSFGGGGGELNANLQRWIDQFSEKGRTVRLTKGKAGDAEYVLADISGTYNKPDGPPFLRKTKPAPGYRMLAAVLVLSKDDSQAPGRVFYLKLTGPDKTVKAHAEEFRKSFGGDVKTEHEYSLNN